MSKTLLDKGSLRDFPFSLCSTNLLILALSPCSLGRKGSSSDVHWSEDHRWGISTERNLCFVFDKVSVFLGVTFCSYTISLKQLVLSSENCRISDGPEKFQIRKSLDFSSTLYKKCRFFDLTSNDEVFAKGVGRWL